MDDSFLPLPLLSVQVVSYLSKSKGHQGFQVILTQNLHISSIRVQKSQYKNHPGVKPHRISNAWKIINSSKANAADFTAFNLSQIYKRSGLWIYLTNLLTNIEHKWIALHAIRHYRASKKQTRLKSLNFVCFPSYTIHVTSRAQGSLEKMHGNNSMP